ncbi:MAG: DUF4926 domain-containing protein [Oscillospiraceae bacterium]|nr:DUF4926 domain-containing protein [Oscillospiraceae bacterium]
MKQYEKVRLTTDKYVKEGIKKGDIGVILKIYNPKAFEVDFSDEKGNTIVLQSFSIDKLDLVE